MLRSDIREGNTIITRGERDGASLVATVTSTRGTVQCKAVDADGKGWNVPYSAIVACSKAVKPVKLVKAVKGDVIQTKNGEKYRIDKVNTSRYSTTRLSDGRGVAVPFTYQFVILDKNSQ